MFDYIKIEGFRSFKAVELNLLPLSVLIGPNGGGKSNLFDLLMLMAQAGSGHLADGVFKRGGFREIAFGFDSRQEVRVEVLFREALSTSTVPPQSSSQMFDIRFKLALRDFGGGEQVADEVIRQESQADPSLSHDMMMRGTAGAVFRVTGDRGPLTDQRREVSPPELAISQFRDSVRYPASSALLEQLAGWTFYRDIDVGPQSLVRQPALVRSGIHLLENGSNLSSVLYAIQQEHPEEWLEISEILKTANSYFVRLTVPAQGGDGKVLLRWFEKPFDREGGQSANLLSDGTLKLLCLIAILKNPEPPALICIDEPEVGLHPDWIKLVAEIIQSAAARTQLIIATHSPQIVARLDPEQVIVADKQDGESHLRRLDGRELEKWLDDFNLSDLWLAGHLGART